MSDLFSSSNMLRAKKPDTSIEDEALTENCPECKEGSMVKRINKQTGDSFFGCSTFPDCEYKRPANYESLERCGICDTGYMIERYNAGRDSHFYGCTNYPNCTNTENIG